MSGPWGVSQQLGGGSLPHWACASWASAEEQSLQCHPGQTGYVKGPQAQVGHCASGLLSHCPGFWGQARV